MYIYYIYIYINISNWKNKTKYLLLQVSCFQSSGK